MEQSTLPEQDRTVDGTISRKAYVGLVAVSAALLTFGAVETAVHHGGDGETTGTFSVVALMGLLGLLIAAELRKGQKHGEH